MGNRGRLFAASFLACLAGFVPAQKAPQHQVSHEVLGPVYPANLPAPDTGPTLDSIHGSVMKLRGATLEIGLQDGGIALFDVATKLRTLYIQGDNQAPTQDVTMLGNRAWWVVNGAQSVRTAGPNSTRAFDIDLSDSGLEGPIRRLSVWQEMIVVHADNGIRFIDPESQRVLTADQVLPADVAVIAKQGMVTTSWKDGTGLFVVVRPYAAKKDPKPGEAREIGMLTAWSAPWRGAYQLLGSYTCDIADFKDGALADTQLSGPKGPDPLPHAIASIGNIQVTNDGIVALNSSQALTIPFYKDNWVTDKIDTALPPHYAQVTACSDSEMWWVDHNKLVRASLEDGSSEVYTPRSKNPIIGVAADDDGAWVLQDGYVKRISDDFGKTSFVKYQVGPESEKPGYGGQARLAFVLKNALAPGGHKVSEENSLAFVRDVLKAAGVPTKKAAALDPPRDEQISELVYGDVIVNGDRAAVYVGDGQQITAQDGALHTEPLVLDEDSSIRRFFLIGGSIPAGARALPIVDIGPVFPIGVNRPDPGLGTDLFVHADPNSPYDHPFLPSHYRLLEIAEGWVGTPYRWGGSSMSGTDCSGFVTSVYKELGIKLPRFSQSIARAPFGEVVFDQLHFGDVLVYPEPRHCAIYIGDGKTIETTRGAVGYSNIYRRHCAYVRRFLFD
jgi:hypothetical protein